MRKLADKFCDEISEEGQKKKEFLQQNKIITYLDRYAPIKPIFRIPWEYIKMIIEKENEQTAQLMQEAKEDSFLAHEYRKVKAVSPIEVFFQGLDLSLSKTYEDYIEGNGIDIEIFLVEEITDKFHYIVEIFPRRKVDFFEPVFASRIQLKFPYITPPHEKESETIVAFILGRFAGSGITNEEVVKRWIQTRGIWEVSKKPLQHLFLNRATLNYLEYKTPGVKKPMLFGGNKFDFNTGENEKAILNYGFSQ